MANNLHISYDLNSPNQNYEAVAQAIQSLGSWAKVHRSVWYVNSNYTSAQAAEIVWAAMDSNDTLYVIDSSNNTANWFNIPNDVANHIQNSWYI